MPLKFNPFSGNFDFAPGVGGTVFDGEVNVFSDLPETISNPPVNSAYLVRNTEGTIWFGSRKQKGIYIRSGNSGVRNDDWTYGGDYPVTSVNGQTGAVVLDAEDVGALRSAYTIESFAYDNLGGSGQMTLPARRNARWTVTIIANGTLTLFLPSQDVVVGDRIHVTVEPIPAATTFIVKKPQPGSPLTLATLTTGARFLYAAQVTQIVSGQPVWQSLGELQATIGAVPSANNSTGTIGSFVFAAQYMYVCIAPNTWRRVPLSDF